MSTFAGQSIFAGSRTGLAKEAAAIIEATGVQGGVVVHVGCGRGRLTAAFGAGDSYLVHGLDVDAADVVAARAFIRSAGAYGRVSVDGWDGRVLPYIDNFVNLLVSEEPLTAAMDEVMRVLAPGSVAYIKTGGKWIKTVKPRPDEIDEWTHYLYDASNNAVAHDEVVGPPRRMQWVGGPRYARHHDRMSSLSASVSAGGRVFYVFDEAPPVSILTAPKWRLIARDAFNGTILWKRDIAKWHDHLWPLKSGPAQLPRRLVASGDRVYVTPGIDSPLVALDAATGETVRTYAGTEGTEEVIFKDGVLFALVNEAMGKSPGKNVRRSSREQLARFWDEEPRAIKAVDAAGGKVLWEHEGSVLPGTLAADASRVVFSDGDGIVCLDRRKGKELWRSQMLDRSEDIAAFYLPILVLYEDVVLFSGGETAGMQTGTWYESGVDTMTALSAKTGEVLWSANHPPSGYKSPEDLLIADGLVWTGNVASGRSDGMFTGRDPYTGEIVKEFPADADVYWFHHRCYRGKATDNYLLMSRAGIEFIDVRQEHWDANHWVRGACLYGVMPANGLIYAPQHPCACYHEAKMYGFNALAPAQKGARIPKSAARSSRLQKGPAYKKIVNSKSKIENEKAWPTYRHDVSRSGRTDVSVSVKLEPAWTADIGGRLTSPVVAAGRLFVASIDRHCVYAIDTASGEELWQYVAGGRVDSPPTIYRGLVLFGSADGYVYALRASDGALAWRFRAAPMDQRLMAFEQIESVWPVHGSVLVDDGVLYCVAGRSMFVDGGMRLLRLDPLTGRAISETVLGDTDEAGNNLHKYVSWLNMPTALPDILSSSGGLIYMRSQAFNPDGSRAVLEAMPNTGDANQGAPPPTQNSQYAHLFSPTGFLDDTNLHRTYLMYGSTFVSGWQGYFLSGKAAPAGKIAVFDDEKVYGFGREPQFFRWTTPIEHQLFAADKISPPAEEPAADRHSVVRVAKSASLNPAGKAITVAAWVKSIPPGGVLLAHGGNYRGYSLYLDDGLARFSVRSARKLKTAVAQTKITGRWAHVAGVLTEDKQLRIYVDGKLEGTAKAPGMVVRTPVEGMEIGADEGTGVGKYESPFAIDGWVDELKVFHRELSESEIESLAAGSAEPKARGAALVCSFDDGKATDESGNDNSSVMVRVGSSPAKVGKGLRFLCTAQPPVEYTVRHHWTKPLELFARAMVLADGTLFVAGPPDVVDEVDAFEQIGSNRAKDAIAAQNLAHAGNKGALLLAVSASDGNKLAQYELQMPPVFDGLIAADGRLFMAAIDGKVSCFGPK